MRQAVKTTTHRLRPRRYRARAVRPGQRFFVNPRVGKNSAHGGQDEPWQSIAYALAQLRPGDTLYLRDGLYTGPEDVIDSQRYHVPSGTSEAPITISGYPGETVILRPSGNVPCVRLAGTPVNYLHVTDLDCDMSLQLLDSPAGGSNGIYVSTGSSYNVFERCRVHDNAAVGVGSNVTGGNSHSNVWRDCEVDHNGALNGVNLGYGFYLDSTDNDIDGCSIHHNAGYGIHIYNFSSSADRNVVRNCHVWANGVAGGENYGILYAQGHDGLIYNNLVAGNRGGISVYTGSANVGVYNNTVIDNAPHPGLALQYYSAPPTARNNLAYGNATDYADYGGTGIATGDHNITGVDPGFVDPANGDYRLTATSPAVNAGTTVAPVTTDQDGVARPQGAAPDVGAYEYAVAPPEPVSP